MRKQVIKLKAIYELLESITDRCEDVANVIEGHRPRELLMDGAPSDPDRRGVSRWSSCWSLALAFDFMNGFHDAANSIATVVSTGVLKPHQAVVWAAFFNFVAIFVFRPQRGGDGRQGHHRPGVVDHYVVFGALVGAIAWNLITWYYGIPSSSSHALIGGWSARRWPRAASGR